MADYNFKLPRLYLDQTFSANEVAELGLPLDKQQSNYVGNVLRLKSGSQILVFNGRDGEYLAEIVEGEGSGRRKPLRLKLLEQTRLQTRKSDLRYLFAPLKQARQDYMVQKAVEMGVSALAPVRTDHTQVARVNDDRLRANAVEACEQCGVLTLPDIEPYRPLFKSPDFADVQRTIIFCDETSDTNNPFKALSAIERSTPLSVLIGPEGGFSENEKQTLFDHQQVVAIPLGPRILRADTAAVAALSAVQMICGDWS